MKSLSKRLGVVALAGLVVVVALAFIGAGPHVAVVVSLVVLIGMAAWFVHDVVEVAVPTDEALRRTRGDPGPRVDRRVTRLRSGLAYGRPDGASLENLRARLIELVDDQLVSAHQIDRRDDPAGARAILGTRLTEFVDDPDSIRDLTRPAELDRILTLIEQL